MQDYTLAQIAEIHPVRHEKTDGAIILLIGKPSMVSESSCCAHATNSFPG